MADEEKIVDAEVQEKKTEKKLTHKEKKEQKKKEKQKKKESRKKHSSGFWMFLMILFVVLLALGVYLPDYLDNKKTDIAPVTEEPVSTPSASGTPEPEKTSSPKAEKTASPSASVKTEETAPPVPYASASSTESTAPSVGRIHTVGKEETLQMIAEKELGDINLWKEILKENPELGNIDGSTILKEGQKLILPEN